MRATAAACVDRGDRHRCPRLLPGPRGVRSADRRGRTTPSWWPTSSSSAPCPGRGGRGRRRHGGIRQAPRRARTTPWGPTRRRRRRGRGPGAPGVPGAGGPGRHRWWSAWPGAAGVRVVAEAFPDRGYRADGTPGVRGPDPGALIDDPGRGRPAGPSRWRRHRRVEALDGTWTTRGGRDPVHPRRRARMPAGRRGRCGPHSNPPGSRSAPFLAGRSAVRPGSVTGDTRSFPSGTGAAGRGGGAAPRPPGGGRRRGGGGRRGRAPVAVDDVVVGFRQRAGPARPAPGDDRCADVDRPVAAAGLAGHRAAGRPRATRPAGTAGGRWSRSDSTVPTLDEVAEAVGTDRGRTS